MVSSIERFHCIQDSQLGPNGVLYREVPLQCMHADVSKYLRYNSCGGNSIHTALEGMQVCLLVYTYVRQSLHFAVYPYTLLLSHQKCMRTPYVSIGSKVVSCSVYVCIGGGRHCCRWRWGDGEV